MNKRLQFEWVVLFVLLGVLLGRIPTVLALKSDAYSFFDTLVDVRTELSRFYVEEPDSEKMLEAAVEGMIGSLNDPFTAYFTPESLEQFDKQTRGSFSGIGAEITTEDGHLAIVSPLEDSPAFEAGIMAGDIILEINGDPTDGLSTEDAVKKITGPEGTQVTIKVRHTTGETVELTITRRRIEIQTIKGFNRRGDHHWSFMLDDTAKIGYVRMTQFSDPTADALAGAIDELKKAGAKGLILDLRFNPGGLLDQAIRISDMFLSSGRIVSTKGRNSPERAWDAVADGTLMPDTPMVVLVNEYSASASEILSGALKDNDRAIVVGTRSFGKGSVQQVMALQSGNGAVKITTAHYYLPSGRNLHRREGADTWGVDPNDGFYVSMNPDQIAAMMKVRRDADVLQNGDAGAPADRVTPQWLREKRADPQLAAALETMLARVDTGEWKKVGESNATLLAFLTEKTALEQRRDAMQESLLKINAKLKELDEKIQHQPGAGDAAKPAEAPKTEPEPEPAKP